MGFSPKNKNKLVYLHADYIDQETGQVIWHRQKPFLFEEKDTYRKWLGELTDSFMRSVAQGDYTLMISVSRPMRQQQELPFF